MDERLGHILLYVGAIGVFLYEALIIWWALVFSPTASSFVQGPP
ncbi:MAG: hypothetical protein WCX97_02695 [Candidatus Magasanikbacteria bacterium]